MKTDEYSRESDEYQILKRLRNRKTGEYRKQERRSTREYHEYQKLHYSD